MNPLSPTQVDRFWTEGVPESPGRTVCRLCVVSVITTAVYMTVAKNQKPEKISENYVKKKQRKRERKKERNIPV